MPAHVVVVNHANRAVMKREGRGHAATNCTSAVDVNISGTSTSSSTSSNALDNASDTRGGLTTTTGFVAVSTWPTGIRLSRSTETLTFVPTGVYAVDGGASAPHIAAVRGRGPSSSNETSAAQWWVLAFETDNRVAVALFTSTAELLSGTAARPFVCPLAPLTAAGCQSPETPSKYFSPTIYTAVYSQRGDELTVDVVMGVAWADASGNTHPANALVDALSPDVWTLPVYRAFFSYDGRGYGDNPFAGPLLWETKMRKAVANFSYTGSTSACVAPHSYPPT